MALAALAAAGVPAHAAVRDVATPEVMRAQYAKWTVDGDSSVEDCRESIEYRDVHPSEEEYGVFGLELASPVYAYDDPEVDWREDVRRVLQVMQAAFNDKRSGDCYRLYVPQTAGMHVHVGLGELGGGAERKMLRHTLPLRSLKNFMQLGTGFERIIDELHSAARIDGRALYCRPPSRFYKTLSNQEPGELVFEEAFMDSTQEEVEGTKDPENGASAHEVAPEYSAADPAKMPPGIVADVLKRVVGAYFGNKSAAQAQRQARAMVENHQWRQQKLNALEDVEQTGDELAFVNAVLVDEILQRATPSRHPSSLRDPRVAAQTSLMDAHGQCKRREFIEGICGEVRALHQLLLRPAERKAGAKANGKQEEGITSSSTNPRDTRSNASEVISISSDDSEVRRQAPARLNYGTTVIDWCQFLEDHVQAYSDLDDRQYRHLRSQAYNLMNFTVSADTNVLEAECKGTIEFRQHRATLDADEVIAWVEVATNMIRFAHKVALTEGSMMAVVKEHAQDAEMGFGPLLQMMGVPDEVVEHYRRWLDFDADHDVQNQNGLRTKQVEKAERADAEGSRVQRLTEAFAIAREQQKNPINVVRTIRMRLKNEDYGLPPEVRERLLNEKYPAVGEATAQHRWRADPAIVYEEA
ncbi:Putative amidoligase enzyme [Macrophomina phaseolina MS6]|uniref:Putative amidoligase enzyme n=1 Tax=Macrophomina phaseolina (strain MS6) TaxID=1126212 RepID=K2R7W2_MACPH|nr:Putative amidoligase enzyme [Macrophomina phaseolina MS6]